jgi:uncharacterized iron-regulated membrane protein
MTQIWLLRLHRWLSLLFALPLLVMMVTGLVLSVEPMLQVTAVQPGTLAVATLQRAYDRADPEGRARGLAVNALEGRLRLIGGSGPEIDLASGEAAATPAPVGAVFGWARRTHEHLWGMDWLVTGSTIAMTVVMLLGTLMGWPRWRNTLSGWHKGAAWITLPLLLLRPLTGLCMVWGLSFAAAPPPAGKPLSLHDAIAVVGQHADLAALTHLRARGGRVTASLVEAGELRNYAVGAAGMTPLPRNWPRLLHEGNWFAPLSVPLNVVTAVVLLGLFGTGLAIWARRRWRRPTRTRSALAAAE